MKRLFIKLLIFVFLFAGINLIYLKLIQKYDWNFNKVQTIASFENQNYDYLIIGNSLALDGFDMVYLQEKGIDGFNTAIAGATPKTNMIQLEKYLENNKAPKVIIQGLSSNRNTDFNSEKLHPTIDYKYGMDRKSYLDLPMIKFRWMAAELLKKVVSKDHREAKLILGQLRTEKTIEDNTKISQNAISELDLSRYQNAKYLSAIDSICLEHKIKLINIEMPAYKALQNNAPIGPITYTNTNGQACQFYNYNNIEFCKLFDPKTDWLGDSHLNVKGALKFTAKLYDEGIFSYQ